MSLFQTKVSYRIPLVGGFTDFPEFYQNQAGQTISCTIDKFLRVRVSRNAFGGFDFQSTSDLPHGIGLGSSGAYHAALILALAKLKRRRLRNEAVAALAYNLESGIEKHSTGRQDSLACLCCGISRIRYLRDGSTIVGQMRIPESWKKKLDERLLLFDTGERRIASNSIKDIFSRENTKVLAEIAKIPNALVAAWERKELNFLATAIDLQEEYRSHLSPTCKSPRTDRLLKIARGCGAGARLTGAGVGSLLCYCAEDNQNEIRKALGLAEIKFSLLW